MNYVLKFFEKQIKNEGKERHFQKICTTEKE